MYFTLSGKPPQGRLPPEIDDGWLQSLKLLDIPPGTVHYIGCELNTAIKLLKQKIENDDPTEEYKVGCSDSMVKY